MSNTVRYGVIGSGMMGVEHINNLLALPGTAVTALADPHPESLAIARAAIGGEGEVAEFDDHRDLIAAGVCDAVVIASPNHTHRQILLDVLASPLHVMVEKPLCTTVADCAEVVAAADDGPADRVVWMGLEYRYMPPTQQLMREIGDGVVGDVKMVAIREHRFPFLDKVGNWNRFNRNTGGTLVEKCCHYFDLMRLVAGADPVRTVASADQAVNHRDERYENEQPDIWDNAYVIVEFANGVRGLLDLCMFAEASANEQELSVIGDAGKAEALVTESVLRIGRRADGIAAVTTKPVHDDRIAFAGYHHGASYLEHLDFLAAIRDGRPAAVTLRDGMWAVAVGQAAQQSVADGGWVDIGSLVDA